MKNIDTRYHPDNEIVKYNFFEGLEHTEDGKDPKTVDQFVKAIHEFEVANGFKDFKKYNKEWAIIFKEYLNDKKNKLTGQNISKSLYFHYIGFVRQFFEWLVANEKEYAKINSKDIGFLHVTRNEENQARATNHQESHDVADILATIRIMPEVTDIDMRNKALLSLYLETTPRTKSIQRARIGRIKYFKDYGAWAFIQDPRLQNTKNSQKITAFFIGQSEDIIQNVIKWQQRLISKGYKGNDYLFPAIDNSFTKDGSLIMSLTKECMKSDTQIRDIVKDAFIKNNLPYIKPHNFRHSIARRVREQGNNVTDTLIALAENYGQTNGYSVMLTSYACDPLERRAKLMKSVLLE